MTYDDDDAATVHTHLPTYPQTLYPHDLPIPTYYVLKMITYMALYATPNPYYA